MSKIRLNLIQKISLVFAVVILPFLFFLGYLTHELLAREMINSVDSIMKLVTVNDSEEVDEYFNNFDDIALNSVSFMKNLLQNPDAGKPGKDFEYKYKIINGALRTNLEAYENKDISGAFLSSRSKLTPEIKRSIIATEKGFDSYSKGVKGVVFNTYLITTDQFIRIYEKDWALEIEPDHDFKKDLFFYVADPEHDPERIPKWTPPYYDSIWKRWMTSLITPIYIDGKFYGIVGHDVILDEIYKHVLNEKYFKSGYCFIFDSQKNIVVHPKYLDKLLKNAKMGSVLNFSSLDEKGLENVVSEAVKKLDKPGAFFSGSFSDNGKEYLFYACRMKFLNWNLASVVPRDEAIELIPYFKRKFMYGAVSFALVVLAAVISLIWFYVLRPVSKFSKATKAIGRGNLDYRITFDSRDEMGAFAQSINDMAANLKKTTASRDKLDYLVAVRTNELEKHKNHLEELVAERTKELKATNEQLKKENAYKIFFEGSSDAMLTICDGYFVDCNESAVRMLKAKNKEEVLNKRPWDLSPEFQADGQKSVDKAQKMISTVLRDGSARFEWLHKRMDGEIFPVEVSLTAIPLEDKTMFNSSLRDITDRKLAEEKVKEYQEHLEELVEARTKELAESNEKLQLEIKEHKRLESDIEQILDASGDAIRVINDQFNIIYVNKEFVRCSNLSEKELIGKKCFDITPEEECHTEKCVLQKILNGEKKIEKDVVKHFDGGLDMPCAMTCGPYTDAKGNIVGMVEHYRDISERLAAQDMAEKNALQQGRIEMSNNILHDIGNAAVGTGAFIIRLLSEKVWAECRSLDRLNDFLLEKKDGISESIGRDKADSLIDFAKKLSESLKMRNNLILELGEKISKSVGHINSVLNLQRQYVREGVKAGGYVNISSLIENAVLMQSANFEKRNIDLTLHFQPGIPHAVPGDNTRLMQVVLNILKNACEAFDETSDEGKRYLKINVLKAGIEEDHIRLVFEDNAVGLSAEMKYKVFSRGFTTKDTGTGIGLDQCRSIINSHDGKIWIESEGVGKGASIIIELPQKRSGN